MFRKSLIVLMALMCVASIASAQAYTFNGQVNYNPNDRDHYGCQWVYQARMQHDQRIDMTAVANIGGEAFTTIVGEGGNNMEQITIIAESGETLDHCGAIHRYPGAQFGPLTIFDAFVLSPGNCHGSITAWDEAGMLPTKCMQAQMITGMPQPPQHWASQQALADYVCARNMAQGLALHPNWKPASRGTGSH